MSFLTSKTKGAISVGRGGGFDVLPVGADGQVLTADSAQAIGVKYADPGTLTIRSTGISGALLTTDDVVLATASPITLTLPDPALMTGRFITVKKTDAAATAVTVAQFAAETIDGAASITLNTQYQSVNILSDGVNWQII